MNGLLLVYTWKGFDHHSRRSFLLTGHKVKRMTGRIGGPNSEKRWKDSTQIFKDVLRREHDNQKQLEFELKQAALYDQELNKELMEFVRDEREATREQAEEERRYHDLLRQEQLDRETFDADLDDPDDDLDDLRWSFRDDDLDYFDDAL